SALQQASSTATGTTPWQPPKPINGGVVQVRTDEYVAWTGGKPTYLWTGLDPTAPQQPVSPNQYRSVHVSTSQKSHTFREKGSLETKFSKTSDLSAFEHEVWQHLVDTGMDTIAYVADPIKNRTMSNCVKEHSRFTVESVERQIANQLIDYDEYDKANDREATNFLLNHLEADLAKDIRDLMEPNEPFPVVFLRVIETVRSTSSERYEAIKARIKKRSASNYPGQDIELLAAAFRADAKELTIAGQYDHNLTMRMLDTFLAAGGEHNEDFRFSLRGIKEQLKKALLDIGYMSSADAQAHMAKEKLTYKVICETARLAYRAQLDNGRWPPARSIKDKRTPPPAFGGSAVPSTSSAFSAELLGKIVATADPAQAAKIFTLIQQQGASPAKPDDVCKNALPRKATPEPRAADPLAAMVAMVAIAHPRPPLDPRGRKSRHLPAALSRKLSKASSGLGVASVAVGPQLTAPTPTLARSRKLVLPAPKQTLSSWMLPPSPA
ncbi:MAG: hypothetical protein ACX936_21115, partial [Marinobacter sp.]